MLSLTDIAAIYGAGLATLLAVHELIETRRLRKQFVVRPTVTGEHGFPHLDFEITYVGSHPTVIHWSGVGERSRNWRVPWRRSVGFCRALRLRDGGYLTSIRGQIVLNPGERLEAHFNRQDLREVEEYSNHIAGFDRQLILLIDHSAGERDFMVPLKIRR